MSAKETITKILQSTDVTLNGKHPWDVQVHNEQVYDRVLSEGSVGLGESYMDSWWDCNQLDEFFSRTLRAGLENTIKQDKWLLLKALYFKVINLQTKIRSLDVAKKHYDLGNTLFEYMLDSRMNYTCAYWKNADTLEEAQLKKLDLVCQKLKLQPGMRVLDIGCGWGALAKYAAEKYDVSVVGVTISKQQYDYATLNCKNLPVEIRLQDYRDTQGQFDRICSIGMFEAVGHLNFRTYMKTVHRNLSDDGLFLLHTIGSNQTLTSADPFISKYIFPNGMLPSIAQLGQSIEKLFVMEDWHNIGAHYDKTLMAWHSRFNQHWDKIKNNYDDRFFRMWNYYLLSCAGAFRARDLQLWQVVLSKNGILGGYEAPR